MFAIVPPPITASTPRPRSSAIWFILGASPIRSGCPARACYIRFIILVVIIVILASAELVLARICKDIIVVDVLFGRLSCARRAGFCFVELRYLRRPRLDHSRLSYDLCARLGVGSVRF